MADIHSGPPGEVFTHTHPYVSGDQTFKATRRTHAHVAWTCERLAAHNPEATLRIIQSCYNTGVNASAGTHDKDAVLDVEIVGMDWWSSQRFLREHGWAAWVRFPPAFTWHIHMVSLGYVGPVGIYVPGQVTDYYNHALGLKGGHTPGSDKSWFPDNIDSTIFDYQEWTMPTASEIADAVWAKAVKKADGTGDTLAAGRLLARAELFSFRAATELRDLLIDRLAALDVVLAGIDAEQDAAATREQVKRVRADLRKLTEAVKDGGA